MNLRDHLEQIIKTKLFPMYERRLGDVKLSHFVSPGDLATDIADELQRSPIERQPTGAFKIGDVVRHKASLTQAVVVGLPRDGSEAYSLRLGFNDREPGWGKTWLASECELEAVRPTSTAS